MNTYIAIGIIVLLGIFSVETFLLNDKSEGTRLAEGQPMALIIGKNALNISGAISENRAIASMVFLEKPGFVVVSEVVETGPGNRIGASALLPSGRSGGVEITLSEPLKESRMYVGVLYHDDGDGVFKEGRDAVAVHDDAGSAPVLMEFQPDSEDSGNSIAI